ncbi:hypothetical protein THARTR1_06481 [Trichoderma harzianum]|uniref:Uncharacterized protein n=1 Tax=Trichoderma harzianum TaxID=5544 RepID=A0A2K0U5B7_TRIHA|nr:hypothetical protein THARTR1_06481 [Trichoderma harzianum]
MLAGIFQRLKSTVKEFIDGISSTIREVYDLSNEERWQYNTAKSAKRHSELLASLNVLKEAITNNNTKSINDSRAQIRDWLVPVSTEDAHNEAKAIRHESTCDWVLDLAAFHSWATCEGKTSKIFWLHGPAGFSKTVLCSRIIDHMESQSNSYGRVLFFFCSGQDREREHPFAILKSWIGQLFAKDDTAVQVAMKDDRLQQKMSEGVAVTEADRDCLWSLFREMVKEVSRCTLVIDGYDECIDTSIVVSKYHTRSCRVYFLQELIRVIDGTGTYVLLVSRSQHDIKEVVMGYCGDLESLRVIDHPITKDDTMKDVSSFSEALFARKFEMPPEKRSDMAGKAVEKSEGMFLWIALLDRRLWSGATKREVEALLSETPSAIDEAYERELSRILYPKIDQRCAEWVVMILKWILFAARPLTVREMAEALAVSSNNSQSKYPHEDLPDPFTEEDLNEDYVDNYILKPCGSLIELRKEHADAPLASQTIHFVHFSVKEFLLRNLFDINTLLDQINRGNRSGRKLCFEEEKIEHHQIAGLCLQYMCYDEFDDASNSGMESPDAFFCTYPFFSYTATSWPEHFYRGRSSNTGSTTSNLVWSLFNTAHRKVWAELFEAKLQDTGRDSSGLQRPTWMRSHGRADSGYGSLDRNQLEDSESEGDEPEKNADDGSFEISTPTIRRKISPSPVYYATILGLADIVERLIENGNNCNLLGGEMGTPLQAAVVNEQGATIEVLLKHKANASQKGGKYGTPLIAAVILSSNDIFDKLIGSCKDIDAADKSGKTALHYACGLGAVDMVKKLVDAGASLNLASKSGRTPLIRAIAQRHTKVVEYLLSKGADANETTRKGHPPLFFAIEAQDEEIAKQLLDHDADPHYQTDWGSTALHEACFVASAPLAQLLLEHGAAVDATDTDGCTPLHYAAQNNSKECTVLMLDSGASPLAGANAYTPFTIAVRQRATDVIEAMNSHEERSASGAASLPARLAITLEEGYVDLVARLFESVGWPSLNADLVRDIRTVALKAEQQAIFHQLKSNVLGLDGPERSSTDMGEEPVWSDEEEEMLRGHYWGSDLQKAMVLDPAWRHFTGARNIVPDAMLPVALANRSHDVVKLLLARSANPYRQLGLWSSSSPALLAIKQDSRELVALILAESRYPAADSILLEAVEACARDGLKRDDMAKILITHGALDANPDAVEDNDDGDDQDLEWWTRLLVGEWKGSYSYSWDMSEDPTGFHIKTVFERPPTALKKGLILFSGGGEDDIAKFVVYGQVTSKRAVRFVKLYPDFGWAYNGRVEKTPGGECHMKGKWARRFDTSEAQGGYFTLKKELPP